MDLKGNATDRNGVVFVAAAAGGEEIASVSRPLAAGHALDVPPGSYEVRLRGLDGHCWMGPGPALVDVTAGAQLDVRLEVTCVGGFAYAWSQSVFYVETDGTVREQARSAPLIARHWDPTGTHLLVTQLGGGCDTWIWRVDGGGMSRLGPPGADLANPLPVWSSDGSRLAAARTPGCGDGSAADAILLFDAAGLTVLDSLVGVNPGSLSWRPSTGELAYTAAGQVRLYSWDGPTESVFLDVDASNVAWSPDGRHVAVEVAAGDQQWISVYDDSGVPVFTTPPDAYIAGEPTWAPDGSGFLFVGSRPPEEGDLYYAAADGSEIRRLTDQPGPDSGPSWSAEASAFLYVAQDPDPPTGIFLGRISAFEPVRLPLAGYAPSFRPTTSLHLEP